MLNLWSFCFSWDFSFCCFIWNFNFLLLLQLEFFFVVVNFSWNLFSVETSIIPFYFSRKFYLSSLLQSELLFSPFCFSFDVVYRWDWFSVSDLIVFFSFCNAVIVTWVTVFSPEEYVAVTEFIWIVVKMDCSGILFCIAVSRMG